MEPIATALLQLRGGGVLEYADYGDPAGIPALFFHGFIGSYHQAAFAGAVARRHGVRLIAPNRPGVGRSTPRRRRYLKEWIPDVQELADALGLRRFGVIGVSGGAPYALACLHALPQRVRGAALVSGLGPVEDVEVLRTMGPLARRVLQASRRTPWLVRLFFSLKARSFHRDPEAFLSRLVRRWSRADQALFTRSAVRSFFLADLKQVLTEGAGPAGMVQELQLYQRWGFRLEDVDPRAKVLLWHGRQDTLVPAAMSEHVARHFPDAELTLYPGGHFMVLDHAEEVVQRALAVLHSQKDVEQPDARRLQ
jgi:pimeloyl-ACP methyl ester carboxylesterase